MFHELLVHITKNKIHHFVVEKTDRAVRNIKDAACLYDWIEGDERRVLHCVKENLELHKWSTSQVKLMWSIFIAFAKQYTDSLREEAMKGWDEKLAQGWLPAPPPPGYKTVAEDGKKIHVPNPENAELMEPIFEHALLPDSSVTSTTEYMATLGITSRKGKPLAKSYVHKLLTNPFYIGINRFNGRDYPGAQEPIVNKKLFYAVQAKLRKGRSVKVRKHNPVFKGLRCAHCGSQVTWQLQKGKFYGRCRRLTEACKVGKMPREDRLEKQVIEKLGAINDPSGRILAKLEAALQAGRPNKLISKHRERAITSLERQLERLVKMDDALYEDRLSGYITKEKYEAKRHELTAQRKQIRIRLLRLHEAQGDQESDVSEPKADNLIVRLYLKSNPSEKRIIMADLIKGLTWSSGKLDR